MSGSASQSPRRSASPCSAASPACCSTIAKPWSKPGRPERVGAHDAVTGALQAIDGRLDAGDHLVVDRHVQAEARAERQTQSCRQARGGRVGAVPQRDRQALRVGQRRHGDGVQHRHHIGDAARHLPDHGVAEHRFGEAGRVRHQAGAGLHADDAGVRRRAARRAAAVGGQRDRRQAGSHRRRSAARRAAGRARQVVGVERRRRRAGSSSRPCRRIPSSW